jgi:hypothetical protein
VSVHFVHLHAPDHVKEIVLGEGCDAELIEDRQQLGAMIGSMIDDMDEGLPEAGTVVALGFGEGLGHEHVVAQVGEIVAHPGLNAVPFFADDVAFVKIHGIEKAGDFFVAQAAEPAVINVEYVDDLIARRADGIIDLLDKLLLGERDDALIPNFAIDGEVIFVQVTEGVGVHRFCQSFFHHRSTEFTEKSYE